MLGGLFSLQIVNGLNGFSQRIRFFIRGNISVYHVVGSIGKRIFLILSACLRQSSVSLLLS